MRAGSALPIFILFTNLLMHLITIALGYWVNATFNLLCRSLGLHQRMIYPVCASVSTTAKPPPQPFAACESPRCPLKVACWSRTRLKNRPQLVGLVLFYPLRQLEYPSGVPLLISPRGIMASSCSCESATFLLGVVLLTFQSAAMLRESDNGISLVWPKLGSKAATTLPITKPNADPLLSATKYSTTPKLTF